MVFGSMMRLLLLPVAFVFVASGLVPTAAAAPLLPNLAFVETRHRWRRRRRKIPTVFTAAAPMAEEGIQQQRQQVGSSQEEEENHHPTEIQPRLHHDKISAEYLVQKVEGYMLRDDQEWITEAFLFCQEAHGTARSSITTTSNNKNHDDGAQRHWKHAVGVAHVLVDLRLDAVSVVVGLLYHAVERGAILDIVQEQFGSEICKMVESLIQMDHLYQYRVSSEQWQAENYSKMMVSMAGDIRVILVKLAEQTHKLRTVVQEDDKDEPMPVKHQKELARETMDIYAPLAERLGIYSLKTEMQDNSLLLWRPGVYRQLRRLVASRQEERHAYTIHVMDILLDCLFEAGLDLDAIEVKGRAKSYYSIFHKMQSQNLAFDDIHDLMAFRIIVNDLGQCYQALGLVHAHWKPVSGRFKDYVALPKPNGYQSLHTTVIGPDGETIEVQIRTKDMDEVAESGIAAHWVYKASGNSHERNDKEMGDAERVQWLRQLVAWVKDPPASQENQQRSAVQHDAALFEKEVFVFTPTGHLLSLAKGATVLDFAYRVHSDMGNHCVGAKVNGKMKPLKFVVRTGDCVEIMQSPKQTPRKDWLDFVVTSKAQSRIKAWLKKQDFGLETIELGRELLEKGLKKYAARNPAVLDVTKEYQEKQHRLLSSFKLHDEQQLLTAIARGQISISQVTEEISRDSAKNNVRDCSVREDDDIVAKSIVEHSLHEAGATRALPNDGVVVGGKRNMLLAFCRNCNPLFGEPIQGVVTMGRGVKVHRLSCRYLKQSDEARRVDAVWDDTAKTKKRPTSITVIFEDGLGMLANVSKAISSTGVNIGGVVLKKLSDGRGLGRFELMLSSVGDLHTVFQELQKTKGVLAVERK